MEQRVSVLKKKREKLLDIQCLNRAILHKYLPSVSAIKVLREGEGPYIAFEGNSRIGALKQIFCPDAAIYVEVEQYCFNNTAKILRRMNRGQKDTRPDLRNEEKAPLSILPLQVESI